MRVAHLTDIHWMAQPTISQLSFKRALGSLNLYLRGRRHHFDPLVQAAAVRRVVDLEPDLVIISGDLTALALPEEFALAREALEPVLSRFPTFIVPGNHDVYTRGAARARRIEELFAPWMALDVSPLPRVDVGDVTAIGLDPNRPALLASGEVRSEQLEALAQVLEDPSLTDRFVFLVLHYPVLDRDGAVYDGMGHGLVNAQALIDLLAAAPRAPDAILHGHIHHGFRVELTAGAARVPIFDPGSTGYAYMPKKRRAGALNLYDARPGSLDVSRFLFDGEAFSEEPGGAYATGR